MREAYIQPDRRPAAGVVPNNRYTLQAGRTPSNLPNRYGNVSGNQNLSQADLARVAADRDRGNGQLGGRSGLSTADRRRYEDRRRGPHRFNPGFYYGNYFPTGIYSRYSPYSAYSYLGELAYGYPYSVLTTGSYQDNYGFSGGDYSLDSVIPDDPAPAESFSGNASQPDAARSGTLPAQPDTLVQDVQAELSRRGYFAGKIDGIVSSAFQAALRRFQTDLKLAPTGLINQASLFALGLN